MLSKPIKLEWTHPHSPFPLRIQQEELRLETKHGNGHLVPGRTQFFAPFAASPKLHTQLQPASRHCSTFQVPHTKRIIAWFCQLQSLLIKLLSYPKILRNVNQPRIPEGMHIPIKGSLTPPEPLITLTPRSAHGNRGEVFIAQMRPQLAKYFTLKICLKQTTLKWGTWL